MGDRWIYENDNIEWYDDSKKPTGKERRIH
jgi:hypothetical protein